jgi:hypothetical protein
VKFTSIKAYKHISEGNLLINILLNMMQEVDNFKHLENTIGYCKGSMLKNSYKNCDTRYSGKGLLFSCWCLTSILQVSKTVF